MLSSSDKHDLIDALCATAEAMGVALSPSTVMVMANDLEVYPVDVLVPALQACRRELTGRLSLAAIMQRVQLADGRPGKDEAWSIALASSDETDTVVMTEEIQLAMGAARPILSAGDKVGARMAFMSAYERLVTETRREAKPASWNVSVGFDPVRRLMAVEQAVQMKRLTAEAASEHLLRLNVEPITADGQAIAGLITGNAVNPSPQVREHLQAIKEGLRAKSRAKEEERQQAAERTRQDLNDRINRQAVAIERAQQSSATGQGEGQPS